MDKARTLIQLKALILDLVITLARTQGDRLQVIMLQGVIRLKTITLDSVIILARTQTIPLQEMMLQRCCLAFLT